MATIRATTTFTPNEDELAIIFSNGDLAALRQNVERLGFQNEESMIRFALAVLAQSATRSLTITDKNGVKVSLNPNASLLKKDEATASELPPTATTA